MIGVIDYSAGNLTSIFNALNASDLQWKKISSQEDFKDFTHLILPGVGAFKHGMDELRARGFIDKINEEVKKGTPFLGICLGMQLLFEKSSEFGENSGLGLIKGEVKDLHLVTSDLTVPHIGWNDTVLKKESKFYPENLKTAYFVHSFFCECKDEKDILCTTDYGVSFCSAVERENVFGVQFHPEKSHGLGLGLLKKFGNLKC